MRCAVLIPVGPGHESLVVEAAASARVAAGRVLQPWESYGEIHDDTKGEKGRSRTRNLLIRSAAQQNVDWIFLLDADDLMAPDAFLSLQAALTADPTLDAVWGTIWSFRGQEPPRERPAQEYPQDYRELIRMEPTLTLQSGFFVRAGIAQAEPWNEDMDAGEDFEMYLRLWKGYRCKKILQPFMFNRRGESSKGPRAATGRDWRRAVMAQLLRAQRAETRQ